MGLDLMCANENAAKTILLVNGYANAVGPEIHGVGYFPHYQGMLADGINTVMTSDKIICLFGRIIPSLSLVISMTLRFVPRFVSKFKELKSARITPQKQGFIIKMKILLSELSVMLSWSLESSIESADSMKSRGYGIKGRTAYNIFKFRKTDVIIITALIISALTMILLIASGTGKYSFYPVLKIEFSGTLSVLFYVIYLGIMLIPSITIAWEGLKWKQLQSKI